MSTVPESRSRSFSPSLACPSCGNRHLQRLARRGFLEKKVYPIFGYYPWECPACRVTRYFKKRGQRMQRKKRIEEPVIEVIKG